MEAAYQTVKEILLLHSRSIWIPQVDAESKCSLLLLWHEQHLLTQALLSHSGATAGPWTKLHMSTYILPSKAIQLFKNKKPAALIQTLCLSSEQCSCEAKNLTTVTYQENDEHANSSTQSNVSLQRAMNSEVMRSPKEQDRVGKGIPITPDAQHHLCRILGLCSYVHSCLVDAAAGSVQYPDVGQV